MLLNPTPHCVFTSNSQTTQNMSLTYPSRAATPAYTPFWSSVYAPPPPKDQSCQGVLVCLQRMGRRDAHKSFFFHFSPFLFWRGASQYTVLWLGCCCHTSALVSLHDTCSVVPNKEWLRCSIVIAGNAASWLLVGQHLCPVCLLAGSCRSTSTGTRQPTSCPDAAM